MLTVGPYRADRRTLAQDCLKKSATAEAKKSRMARSRRGPRRIADRDSESAGPEPANRR